MSDSNADKPASPAPADAPKSDAATTAAPAAGSATSEKPAPPARKGPPKKLPQEWLNTPTQRAANRVVWLLVGLSTCLAVALGAFIIYLLFPKQTVGPVVLGNEFKDQEDSFIIQPPVNWGLQDRVPGTSIVIKGPVEKGFSPIIMVALEIAPGRLNTFIEDHKYKVEKQDSTVKWLSEDDDNIDGCQTKRLEYECELPTEDNKGTVKVRALQYILMDRPRFYKITAFVAEHAYEKYLAKFEASARSFQRMALKGPQYKIINE